MRALRQLRKLRQDDLADTMNDLGFFGWSRVTVSDVERGVRITNVDELFALAIALRTTVVKLLDPQFSGDEGPGIGIHFAYPEAFGPEDARKLILFDDDPWRLDRPSIFSYADYRRQIHYTAAGLTEEDHNQ